MAYTPDYRARSGTASAPTMAAAMDTGLRAYMLRVYNWMASGLVLTGLVAYFISSTPALLDAFYPLVQLPNGQMVHHAGMLAYIAMFAPLGFILVLSFGVQRLSATAVQGIFWAYAATMGASLTTIFLTYTGESVVRVFFITAGTFAATSIFGYVTKADLTKMGSFLMMGLFGIILASVVNMFLGSAGLQFAISILGVLIFTGLTAYDTQRIKASYLQFAYGDGTDEAKKRSVFDALSLYLNFINLFMFLLQFMGDRRS